MVSVMLMWMVVGAGVEGDWIQSVIWNREAESGTGSEPAAWTSARQHRALLRPRHRQSSFDSLHNHGILWGRRPCFIHQEDEGFPVCDDQRVWWWPACVMMTSVCDDDQRVWWPASVCDDQRVWWPACVMTSMIVIHAQSRGVDFLVVSYFFLICK